MGSPTLSTELTEDCEEAWEKQESAESELSPSSECWELLSDQTEVLEEDAAEANSRLYGTFRRLVNGSYPSHFILSYGGVEALPIASSRRQAVSTVEYLGTDRIVKPIEMRVPQQAA
jgi:hypothetical protein